MATRHQEVWQRSAPKKARHTQLTPAKKAAAKAAAKRAGRPYPNLIDNMRVAKKKTSAHAAKKKS